MTYASGGLIDHGDFNTIIAGNAVGTPTTQTNTNINMIYGPGQLDHGYGQTEISPVSAGSQVAATQWANMLNKMSTIASHQGVSLSPVSSPSTGTLISYVSTINTNLNTIYNNRYNCAGHGTQITAGGVVSRTTGWYTSVTMPMTVTFASVDAMRYFFNAGGLISMQFSRSGGTVSAKNTSWTDLCTAMGTLYTTGASASKVLGGPSYTGFTKVSGSGTPTTYNTALGYYAMTTVPATQILQYGVDVNYTLNYIQVQASANLNVLTLTVLFEDDANANTDEIVDGTLTTTITAIPPETTFLTNTWGTPTLGGSQSGA